MRSLFVAVVLVCLAPLQAAADPWLVVSDIHLNPYDLAAKPSGYGSDSNWSLWESALAAMRATQPRPTVIVVDGDMLAHHFPALAEAHHDVPAAQAEATMRRISQSLRASFPHAQLVVALGNNDDPCGDYRMRESGAYLEALSAIWSRPLQVAGSYTAPLGHERAVVLDDVYWSQFYRPCTSAESDAPRRELTWLQATLDARPQTRDVLVEHIPPGVDVVSTLAAHRFLVLQYLSRAYQAQYLTALESHASRIGFAIAGHAHRSDFRILGGVPTVVAPSISPIYGNNPAFLSLDVASSGALLDYALVAYDPTRATWSRIFDFDRVYRTHAVDAAGMRAAHDEIATDATLRARWESALVAGSPHRQVDAGDWRAAWCAQTATGEAFTQCAGLRRRLLVIPIVAALVGIIVIASLVLILTRLLGPAR